MSKFHRAIFSLTPILALIVVSVTSALAADYYVRTDGSDSCNGTADTGGTSGTCAFRTISRANTVAACGDTIHIGAGRFSEPKIRVTNVCTAAAPKRFVGSGRGTTLWMAGLNDVNEGACTADTNANVYRCPAPPGFATGAAGNNAHCLAQRTTNHVRFLDENGTTGDMVGPVCLTWNTNGAADVSTKEGHAYFDGNGTFFIRPWDDLPPAQADFWAPNATNYASGADGPVVLAGNHLQIQDVTIIGSNYTNLAASGTDLLIERIEVYTGMGWFNGATERVTIRDMRILNAYRRPVNGGAATDWGRTNSQVLSIQGKHFTIENLETYAAREGIGFTGASFIDVNGLFAHGHHNHLLKFIDGAHDIAMRDCMTYNGQEPVFIECAYNLEFSNCTFPFSSIVIQANPTKTCTPATSNIDFFNNAWCGVHYFNLYGNTWAAGGHDLDNNVYMTDHGACHQNSWLVGADGIKFETMSEWRNWNGGTCAGCTRDPNSRTDLVANTWVSYKHRDDTLGANYDFDLKPGAQAINAGNPAHADGFDIENVAREGNPDAGAYESGSDSGGGGVCGNGVLEAGEQCDGSALGGRTCSDLGYGGGTLGCTSSCTYDTTACTALPGTPNNLRRTDVK